VIPCFNQGGFLKEAVESVLAQTLRPERIIVVDDGSTDNTAAAAAEYPQVDYIFQKNRGLAAARNTGLRRVTTEFVLFHDSDDILKPTAIERCLMALDKHPQAAFVYGGFWWVDQKRGFLGEELAKRQTDHFGALLAKNYIMMHGTVMYRTEILRSAGGFNESLPRCEDYDVYLRLTQSYPIEAYEGVAAEYRRHNDNISLNAALMLKTVRKLLARHSRIAQTKQEWRVAHAEGVRYWSGFWGPRIEQSLIEECKGRRRLNVIASMTATGLRYDPEFVPRLSRRILRKVRAAFGRTLRKGAAPSQ
jgi:glycosyltransferase involved in cell wall biosynthesis